MHVLDALGNPVRRDILVRLKKRPATAGEIAARFTVSRPAISRHLAMLRRAGLVTLERDGARRVYAVRLEGFLPVRSYLDSFWDIALARLERLAHTKKATRR